MSSGVQTFTPNAYMASTSGPVSSSAAFMNPQNYMMGGGMMAQQQQFMPMPMPMNLASSGANMYGNSNYGMSSAATSANNASSGSGSNNSSSNNFPVDPFMTPLGYPDASFGSTGFPMSGMPNLPMQQQQMMSMNGGNFGTQGTSMMPNNFGYGGMPTSSALNMMPQSLPTQQFQSTPQPFQPQQTDAGSLGILPDTALYGDSNVNIFEGLADDAFFPMQ